MKDIDWDDLRLFLAVARSGGLTAALAETGGSAATLSRRMRRLEEELERTLFIRSQDGYVLTPDGAELLARLGAMQEASRLVDAWRRDAGGQALVRIVAGTWNGRLICQNLSTINPDPGRLRISLETGETRSNLAFREADIGLRAVLPDEPYLASRKISSLAYARYRRRNATEAEANRLVVVRAEEAISPYLRWARAQSDLLVAAEVSRPVNMLDLARAGAGTAVLPCFVGDLEPDLVRVGGVIPDLTHDQWIVMNAEDRDRRPIRDVVDRLTALMIGYRDLYEGRRPG